jgi:hypothetical protein
LKGNLGNQGFSGRLDLAGLGGEKSLILAYIFANLCVRDDHYYKKAFWSLSTAEIHRPDTRLTRKGKAAVAETIYE